MRILAGSTTAAYAARQCIAFEDDRCTFSSLYVVPSTYFAKTITFFPRSFGPITYLGVSTPSQFNQDGKDWNDKIGSFRCSTNEIIQL